MQKHQVVMTGALMPPALERVQAVCEVKLWDQGGVIPREVLFDWLRDAVGLVVTGKVRVDDELLSHGPNLKVIAQSAVGYDNIDIPACIRHGIPFGNTPGVLVDATADLTFTLLLSAARRVHEGWNFVREGHWSLGKDLPYGTDIRGKTLGIVGMGRIGAAVAARARAFGMKIIYYNRTPRSDEAAIGATYQSFDSLLAQADCIIVLTPLSAATKGLFGREQFARMKPTAYFVNASRGPVVDTAALVEALTTRKIAYAALDVTDPEPLPADHPLLKLPNILVTPHIGSATTETRTAMSQLTADNLLAGLAGKPLKACVNGEVNYK
ncbi:2-hydroxyacid dehydrogenase [Acetonema longum]|uniref:Glyoxylate/hydroxypyruvate reductase B n=1 Tax=Acetonema longum DSM 6540 TaxID=1009370 RepID=F7NHY3_9FIRM|nr:D-glycerate dehydrogenase [Acetonema longum]EGO64362.1 glyoxylate reductase [Acetonema longum DSM 6540]